MSRLTATPISRLQASKSRARRASGKRQLRQTDIPVIHPLLQMQQTHGNRAVGRLIQAQLKVSQPGDQYEQEADRVADHVMRMPEPASLLNQATQSAQPPTIQRLCSECETEMQRQPTEEEKKPEDQLQRQAKPGHNPTVHPSFQNQITSLQSSGRPLNRAEDAFFEPRFGRDFSQVRVHTDGQAAHMAKSINAKAFTVGRNIAFGSAEYQPETDAGRKLLAHELTHVVQQSSGHNAVPTQLQRTIGDGHDLNSTRFGFAGDERLEACYDNEARLTKGDQGESVMKVQKALAELRYLEPSGVDGIYGEMTWNAVKQFKADQKLGWEWMGDVGPGTMQRLDELLPDRGPPHPPPVDLTCDYFKDVPELIDVLRGHRLLQKGDSGEGVLQLQQVLLLFGYPLPRYGADAQFGDETKIAVSVFQSDQGLPPSGVLDSESLEQLPPCSRQHPPIDWFKISRKRFYGTNNSFSRDEKLKIKRSIISVISGNFELLKYYYAYYSGGIFDRLKKGDPNMKLPAETAHGITTIKPDSLDLPDTTLGGILIHEFVHTHQWGFVVIGDYFDPGEGEGLGVEYFFAERTHNDRVATIRAIFNEELSSKFLPKHEIFACKQFKIAYGVMKTLHYFIDKGGSTLEDPFPGLTAEEARELVAEYVRQGEPTFFGGGSERLKAIVNWVTINRNKFIPPGPPPWTNDIFRNA